MKTLRRKWKLKISAFNVFPEWLDCLLEKLLSIFTIFFKLQFGISGVLDGRIGRPTRLRLIGGEGGGEKNWERGLLCVANDSQEWNAVQ